MRTTIPFISFLIFLCLTQICAIRRSFPRDLETTFDLTVDQAFVYPRFPPVFVSNWSYALVRPNQTIAQGWTIWAGFNDTLYYYMSAYNGWEQIVQGTKIYNFCRKQATCCYDDYQFPIVQDYFQQMDLIGPLPSALDQIEWVGSLPTQQVMGIPQTFILRTQASTGFPIMYISANIAGTTFSENMFLLNYQFIRGPDQWFQIPAFCITSQPCLSNNTGCPD